MAASGSAAAIHEMSLSESGACAGVAADLRSGPIGDSQPIWMPYVKVGTVARRQDVLIYFHIDSCI